MSVRWSAADAERRGLRMFAMALLPRVTLLRRRRTRGVEPLHESIEVVLGLRECAPPEAGRASDELSSMVKSAWGLNGFIKVMYTLEDADVVSVSIDSWMACLGV